MSSPQVKFKEAEVVDDPGEETADGVGDEFVLEVVEFEDPEEWLDDGGIEVGTDPYGMLAESPSTEARTVVLV